MNEFDPEPGKPYAICRTCKVELAEREDGEKHMTDTDKGDGSHVIAIKNPTRKQRIQNEITRLAEDAVYEFVDLVYTMMDDATEEELSEAIANITVDFNDVWQLR